MNFERDEFAEFRVIGHRNGVSGRSARDITRNSLLLIFCPSLLSSSSKGRHQEWLSFTHFRATIREALEKLNDLVDESDPDTDLPNIVHAFQTAERARAEFPDLDWLHLVGLIHDLGKVMAFYGEPQWAVVGDTFPVGCEWSENIVYREESFEGNPDGQDPRYK